MADKQPLIQPDRGQDAISIHLVNRDGFPEWKKSLSASQRAALDAKVADIAAGNFHPFDGPVLDQAGEEKIAAGSTLSDGELLIINRLVNGVETNLPK